jgi:hypothetical protein
VSDDELATKFLGCAQRSLTKAAAERAFAGVRAIDDTESVRTLTGLCVAETGGSEEVRK